MAQPPADEAASPGTGAQRSMGEVLLAVLAGSALAPFVQAVATTAGEDVYGKISDLLGRRPRRGSQPEPGIAITLADAEKAIVLELPTTLSAKDATELATVRLPTTPYRQWLLVRHDSASQAWTITAIPAPPTEAIEINDHDQ